MSRHLAVRLLAVGVALAALAGCGGDPAPIYAQAFGYRCDEHDSPSAQRWCRKKKDPGAAQVSRYCYHSIGGTNCFDRPDPDNKNQPLGSSGY